MKQGKSTRHFRTVLFCILIMLFAASCATTRTVNIWKDEKYTRKLDSALVIGVAELDFMRDHFENVLSLRLADRGVKAVASNKIFPDSKKLNREIVAAKVRELGIGSVLIGRAVSKTAHSHMIKGGSFVVPVEFVDGWYNTYDTFMVPVMFQGSDYDAEYFNMLINVYDTVSEKLVWSDLLRVKVENSRQGAINPLIDEIIKDMQSGRIIP